MKRFVWRISSFILCAIFPMIAVAQPPYVMIVEGEATPIVSTELVQRMGAANVRELLDSPFTVKNYDEIEAASGAEMAARGKPLVGGRTPPKVNPWCLCPESMIVGLQKDYEQLGYPGAFDTLQEQNSYLSQQNQTFESLEGAGQGLGDNIGNGTFLPDYSSGFSGGAGISGGY